MGRLFGALHADGYTIIAPVARDGAIVHDAVTSPAELPVGWTDHQAPGRYTLDHRESDTCFGYASGPQGWKPYLFPARERLFSSTRSGTALTFAPDAVSVPRRAFLGVRACDLAAIHVQDRVFADDPRYAARRANVLLLAVECTRAADTCFCASLGSGPAVESGYDVRLTEMDHHFLVDAATAAGKRILDTLALAEASAADIAAADAAVEDARARQHRRLDTGGLGDALTQALTHPHWEAIATRCLSCANCTLVCPTCFCSTVEDTMDLTGDHAERWRRWDSCFTLDHSYVHGGSVRASAASRYRQWLTHKFANWERQFGVAGCTGCGRCITWCPVGIDVTAELPRFRAERTTHGNA